MRKFTFTFILILLIIQISKAQINLSNSVFPAIGTTWITYQDNRTGVHTITPASGSAQTWNYANAFVVDDTSFISWKNPSATPYASNFPQATHAEYDPVDDFAVYYKGNSSGFYTDGFYDGQQSPPTNMFDFNPDFLVIPIPFTYNNNRNNNARIELIQTGPPAIKVTVTIVQQMQCDAFGTLTTPVFSNQQVLRIKWLQYSVDSTFMDLTGTGQWMLINSNPPQDSQLVYMFIRNQTSPSLLMEILADPASPTSSQGASYNTSILTGIQETVPQNSISVYPNPISNGWLKFSFEGLTANSLELYDLAGKRVYSSSVAGIHSLKVSVDDLAPGAYLYQIRDNEGKTISNGKVMVAR